MRKLSDSLVVVFFASIVFFFFFKSAISLDFSSKCGGNITGVKRPAETNNQQKDEDESKKSKKTTF